MPTDNSRDVRDATIERFCRKRRLPRLDLKGGQAGDAELLKIRTALDRELIELGIPINNLGGRRIVFEFVDQPFFSASSMADARREWFMITASQAMPSMLRAMFRAALAHPDLFGSIGNPTLESRPTHLWSDGIATFLDSQRGSAEPAGPRDALRSDYADMLAELSIEFVLLHELGHVISGHLHLRDRLFAAPSPLDKSHAPGTDPDEIHALELDADLFAAGPIASLLNNGTSLLEPKLLKSLPSRARLEAFALAVGLLFVFEADRCGDRASTDHPSPQVRLAATVEKVSEQLGVLNRDPASAGLWTSAFRAALRTTRDVCNAFGLQHVFRSDFLEDAEQATAEAERLFSKLPDIHERLAKYDMRQP